MKRTVRTLLFVSGAVLALIGSPTWSQEIADCWKAELPGRLALADGSVTGPGFVRICYKGLYVPGKGMNLVEVNGVRLGLLFSRIGRSEEPTQRPLVVFERNQTGEVRLIGYAVPEGAETVTHMLFEIGKGFVPERAEADRLLWEGEERVLVAGLHD